MGGAEWRCDVMDFRGILCLATKKEERMSGGALLWIFGGLFLLLVLGFLFSSAKNKEKSESPYVAGIQISKNGTSSVVDVGAYFGSIGKIQEKELYAKKEVLESENESRMRAERMQALTVSSDGTSSIKGPENLVRYFKNVSEENRRAVLLETKK